MNYYFVAFVVVAWVLTWFNFEGLFIKGVQELLNKEITVAAYYIIFLTIGFTFDLITLLKSK